MTAERETLLVEAAFCRDEGFKHTVQSVARQAQLEHQHETVEADVEEHDGAVAIGVHIDGRMDQKTKRKVQKGA